MHTNKNIAIGIHLQQIAIERVEPEATHWKCWIIFELQYLLRIAHRDQTLLYQVEAQLLILR